MQEEAGAAEWEYNALPRYEDAYICLIQPERFRKSRMAANPSFSVRRALQKLGTISKEEDTALYFSITTDITVAFYYLGDFTQVVALLRLQLSELKATQDILKCLQNILDASVAGGKKLEELTELCEEMDTLEHEAMDQFTAYVKNDPVLSKGVFGTDDATEGKEESSGQEGATIGMPREDLPLRMLYFQPNKPVLYPEIFDTPEKRLKHLTSACALMTLLLPRDISRHSPDELLWQFLGHYRKGIAEEAIDQHEAANSSFEKAFKCGELYPWIEPVDLMRVSTACSRTAIRIGNYEAAWKGEVRMVEYWLSRMTDPPDAEKCSALTFSLQRLIEEVLVLPELVIEENMSKAEELLDLALKQVFLSPTLAAEILRLRKLVGVIRASKGD